MKTIITTLIQKGGCPNAIFCPCVHGWGSTAAFLTCDTRTTICFHVCMVWGRTAAMAWMPECLKHESDQVAKPRCHQECMCLILLSHLVVVFHPPAMFVLEFPHVSPGLLSLHVRNEPCHTRSVGNSLSLSLSLRSLLISDLKSQTFTRNEFK